MEIDSPRTIRSQVTSDLSSFTRPPHGWLHRPPWPVGNRRVEGWEVSFRWWLFVSWSTYCVVVLRSSVLPEWRGCAITVRNRLDPDEVGNRVPCPGGWNNRRSQCLLWGFVAWLLRGSPTFWIINVVGNNKLIINTIEIVLPVFCHFCFDVFRFMLLNYSLWRMNVTGTFVF